MSYDQITTDLDDGVLTITLPKKEEKKARKLTISSAA